MGRFHICLFRAAVASIALGLTICRAAADTISSADIEAALARGDVALSASQYATAEVAYRDALRLAEGSGGSQSELVIAPLLGLGKTFAGSGHRHEAVLSLQRALGIARTQYGLFDLRQQDILQLLATSLTALDRVPEAQELMIYRVRTAEKNYGEGNHKVIPAVCELGDWFAEVGMPYEARMAFQMALSIAGTTPALNDSIIVEPLRGLARTRMRLRSYPESMRPKRRRLDTTTQWVFPKMGPRELDEEGEGALQRAVRIVESDPDASKQMRIETLIQMGDWYQIKKAPREALPHYQRAWELIHTTPSLSGSATTALNVPLRVYYPMPDIVANVPQGRVQDARSHHVQVEFTVAADGSVRDARIVDHNTRDRYADDILDAVRDSRFRPKFVDGQPVAAAGISYREVFWTGKTPE